MNRELFAFWEYSDGINGFKYYLGGTVTRFTDKGNVETKEYGRGHVFKPIKVMPLKAGKELMAKLEAIREERCQALKQFKKDWDDKIVEAFPL